MDSTNSGHYNLRAMRISLMLCLLVVLMGWTSCVFSQVLFRSASSAAVQAGSAGISYVGSGGDDDDNNGDVNPSLPNNYQTGDLLLCQVESHDTATHAISNGWNTAYSIAQNGNRASLFWRIAPNTSLNDPTISHDGSSIVANCVAYRGTDQTTPFDVAYAAASSGGNSDIASGALTTVTDQAWLLFTNYIADNPGSLAMTTTGGLTWTRRVFSTSGSGNDSGIGFFDAGPLSPQTVGPVVATANRSAANTGVLLALRPAGGNALTIVKPAGTLTDDLMVASISVRSSAIQTTPPSGWTLLREVVRSGTTSSVLRTYYKLATASEPAAYTWTMSGGAHVGVVGGIMSFSGEDLVTPIADDMGVATASSTNHVAPTVTTSKASSFLVTVHEYASSGTWTPPSGMTEAVDVASQTPSDTGVSMEMNYQSIAALGATGTRQASANGNADFGATQSLVVNPAGGLSCFGDDFNRANGDPGSNWLVGNAGGSFGNPTIVNNRLRLTDASQKASTYATLQRLFPGAGNKIIVEFTQYSYGGSGADGMGIVLSDASLPPVAGAFGGSMGYAPKQTSQGGDTTHEGFTGGWLGVALDEFGNYSANTEGRSGGSAPGVTADSVAIRGSGNGFTGYPYLAGTGSLAPGIDNAGSSSPAPGYKYRITVDHSDSVHAWTSVERDTGSGYTFIVPVFDAKANATQAAVPTNWRLSYTGATGGNANIHEIDALQVCSFTQRALTLHHIELDHSSTACGSEPVVVKACADAACTALYTGTVTVDLTSVRTSGSGTPSFSTDPVTFSGGQTSVTLNKTNTGSNAHVTIGGAPTSPTAPGATVCLSDTGATNCDVSFVSACFDAVEATTTTPATPIYTKLTSTNFKLNILAIRNGVVNTSNDGSVSVALVNPDAASGNCSDTNTGLTSQQTVDLNNGVGTTANISYPAAAKNVRVRMTSGGVSTCSTDNFAIRPKQFTLSTDVPTPGTYSAGRDFQLSANPGVSAGYDGTPTLVTGNIAAFPTYNMSSGAWAYIPANSLPLNGNFNAATGGVAQGQFEFDDVGALDFKPDAVIDSQFTAVDQVTGGIHGTSPDCNNNTGNGLSTNNRYGCTIGSTELWTGRFKPDHYDVTAKMTAACGNKFSYMGQQALGINLNLQALSSNGSSLPHYGPGYGFLSTFSVSGVDPTATFDPSALNARLSPDLLAFGWIAGAYAVNANYSFDRKLVSGSVVPDGSYEQFALKVSITDTDLDSTTNTAAKITTFTNSSGPHTVSTNNVTSDPTAIRFGRLALENANGSELLSLPVKATTQYWINNVGFVTNIDDTNGCTVIDPASIKLQNQKGGLNATNMPANNFVAAPLSFSSGRASVVINKPLTTPLSKGSVDLCVDLGLDLTPGTVCSATPANMPWLQWRWNPADTLYKDDPSTRATFGVYKSGPVIYLRETY
ncbi:MAG TPA: DUF6701 domain-containing protein [Oxalicibacterium sp.]|nr:DUF6701 domain-containing protein [Oxalicibacterium sp.]